MIFKNRKQFVIAAKFAMLILIIITTSIVVIIHKLKSDQHSLSELSDSRDILEFGDAKIVVDDLVWNTKDKNDKPIVIKAENAKRIENNKIVVKEISGSLYIGGSYINLKAARGLIAQDTQSLELNGDVIIEMENGYQIFLEKATVLYMKNILYSEAPIKVLSKFGKIEAGSIEISEDVNIKFKNNVRVSYYHIQFTKDAF